MTTKHTLTQSEKASLVELDGTRGAHSDLADLCELQGWHVEAGADDMQMSYICCPQSWRHEFWASVVGTIRGDAEAVIAVHPFKPKGFQVGETVYVGEIMRRGEPVSDGQGQARATREEAADDAIKLIADYDPEWQKRQPGSMTYVVRQYVIDDVDDDGQWSGHSVHARLQEG